METNLVYHFFEIIKQERTKTGSNLTILIVAFYACVNFCIIWSISAIWLTNALKKNKIIRGFMDFFMYRIFLL